MNFPLLCPAVQEAKPMLVSTLRKSTCVPQVFTGLAFLLCLVSWAWGDEPPRLVKSIPARPPTSPAAPVGTDQTVEQVTALARKSVVVVSFSGRDGKRQGLGSGFIIRPSGLIATNLHVVGEGRPITVQLADGREFPVRSIYAHDRKLDLAVLQIDADQLPALALGNSDTLQQGQAILALGNPLGLKHSVVSGVLSGTREIDGRPMLQLALPIEPGNSGGPVLDLQARVQGIVTMKSVVSDNLGFAVAINQLKPLLTKPNPTSLQRWLTLGVLDSREWLPLFGANWRQRGGRILVSGLGEGFGGRALCLSKRPVPALPCEVSVSVKLEQESGAAGLVFHSDGEHRHYGFYPSAGKLRLTRFDGADVFSWKVLAEISDEHYLPGEWNTLKVHLSAGKIACYVNNHLVLEREDTGLTKGGMGLAKFRDTTAEFRNFTVARDIPAAAPGDVDVALVQKLADQALKLPHPSGPALEKLAAAAPGSTGILRVQAQQMEAVAKQLRALAIAVHQHQVCEQLAAEMRKPEAEINLLVAGLLIARLDSEDVDVAGYRATAARLAEEIQASLAGVKEPAARIQKFNRLLFEEYGFHGSRSEYYHRSNSYLNEVLDDREGLPITLSIVYMELARRMGLNFAGVGLPGHFIVKYLPEQGMPRYFDPFDGGKELSRADLEQIVLAQTGRPLQERQLATVSKREIVIRMLRNLLNVATRDRDLVAAQHYLDSVLFVFPDAAEERWLRAILHFQRGNLAEARRDAARLLRDRPANISLQEVEELNRLLEREPGASP